MSEKEESDNVQDYSAEGFENTNEAEGQGQAPEHTELGNGVRPSGVRPNVQVTPQKVIDFIVAKRVYENTSWRELERLTGIPKTTLHEKFNVYCNKLRRDLQQEGKLAPDEPDRMIEEIDDMPNMRAPATGWLLTPALATAIRTSLEPKQQRIFDSALQLAAQEQASRLNSVSAVGSQALSGSGEDEFFRELAKSERIDRGLRLRGGKGSLQNGDEALERVARILKMWADLVPKGSNDQLANYRTGRVDEANIQSQLARAANNKQSSEIDLKLEELRQAHDIDMENLRWTQQKYFLQLEADKDKWGSIKETFAPVLQMGAPQIEEAMRKGGVAIGKSLDGLGSNPVSNVPEVELLDFGCPKCGVVFTIPKSALSPEQKEARTQCPKCGEMIKLKNKESPPEEEPTPRGKIGVHYT